MRLRNESEKILHGGSSFARGHELSVLLHNLRHAGEGIATPGTPSNKGMKLTKLSAAPEHGRLAWLSLRCRLMPAPAGMDAGTASQLIPGVRRTRAW